MPSDRRSGAGSVAGRAGSVVRVLRAPGSRERIVVLPREGPTPRRRAMSPLWLLPVPLLLAPLGTAPEDDARDVPVARTAAPVLGRETAAGEVDLRPAAERFVEWEGETASRAAGDSAWRDDVARGIALLADALAEGTRGDPAAESVAAMRWHGAQLRRWADGTPDAESASAGHVHAAFVHAARLLARLPEAPGGIAAPLGAAAEAVTARPLAVQRAPVDGFFHRAATVLATSLVP
jgi:hypothetical protein